jgi:hypothetical protein
MQRHTLPKSALYHKPLPKDTEVIRSSMKEMGRSNPACEMMEQALSQNSTSSNKKILPGFSFH